MSLKCAIPFGDMSENPKRPTAVRPPASYGRYLERLMEPLLERLGIGREAFAKRAKIDPQTLRRNLAGTELRSVKGMNTIRDALVAHGLDVIPVPTTEDWTPPPAPLPAAAERVRRNLIRFRTFLDFDHYALSRLSKVSIDVIRNAEAGAEQLTMQALDAIAAAMGGRPGAFFEDPAAPMPELKPPKRWWLGGPDSEDIPEEANNQIDEIMRGVVKARDKQRRK